MREGPVIREDRTIRFHCSIAVAAMLAAVAGCATVADPAPEERYAAQIQSFQAEAGAGDPESDDYRIGPEDLLEVTVMGEPDLAKRVRVPDSGAVTFPLIGTVQVGGHTVKEVERLVAEKLAAEYLQNPQVNVSLLEYRQGQALVLGEVNSPGPYRVTRSDTLMEMLTKARGFTPLADVTEVKVVRRSEGGPQVVVINTRAITEDGNLQENIPIRSGDIIIVPERFF
ncbi:MAG: polysaccharide biosynthesis/export family protein [Candidatus Methylomirabilis sp.]|nr:polysaccharide biosynthesis/export family protein [Deltaproteobacteria bacterium]